MATPNVDNDIVKVIATDTNTPVETGLKDIRGDVG
jgi:hypothetical protein